MVGLRFLLLALFGFVAAQQSASVPELDVAVSASFPNSEIFGIKLVNGQTLEAQVSFANNEPDPITVSLIAGSLWHFDPITSISHNLRNLTTSRYNVQVPSGSVETITYEIATEIQPQDLRLNLVSLVTKGGSFFTIPAFNGTITIVEPEISIFDPQILFLYFFLLVCFGSVLYFFYNVWIVPYLPQKRKGGERKKAAAEKPETIAEDTSGKTFNTEWIPAHHLSRPEPRKVRKS